MNQAVDKHPLHVLGSLWDLARSGEGIPNVVDERRRDWDQPHTLGRDGVEIKQEHHSDVFVESIATCPLWRTGPVVFH